MFNFNNYFVLIKISSLETGQALRQGSGGVPIPGRVQQMGCGILQYDCWTWWLRVGPDDLGGLFPTFMILGFNSTCTTRLFPVNSTSSKFCYFIPPKRNTKTALGFFPFKNDLSFTFSSRFLVLRSDWCQRMARGRAQPFAPR